MDREYVQNSLANAGFTDVQSETLSHIVGQLATKADLDLLRVELRGEMRELRAEMQEARAELRAELQETRAKLRAEMLETRAKLRTEMQEMRGELAGELNTVCNDLRTTRADLVSAIERSARETQLEMTKMMVGLIISLATIFTLLDLSID